MGKIYQDFVILPDNHHASAKSDVMGATEDLGSTSAFRQSRRRLETRGSLVVRRNKRYFAWRLDTLSTET